MADRNDSMTKGSRAKKKYVAKSRETEVSQQKVRTVKPHKLKEWFGRLREALKINQKQGENSQRKESKRQEEARNKRETNKRNQESRRNERLAAEKEARERLEKENKKAQKQEKREIADIEAKNNAVNKEIKGLTSHHETNNARKEKIDKLRQRVRKRNELRNQDENNQTMILDRPQKGNKEVVKADGEVRNAQKEADKKVEEVKSKTENVAKQVKDNDIARLSGQNQDVIDRKLNEIDAPSKGQNGDKKKSKENEKLSPEEIKMLRKGVNPKDKAQVTRFEAEQNRVHSSEGEHTNSQTYQRPVHSIGD